MKKSMIIITLAVAAVCSAVFSLKLSSISSTAKTSDEVVLSSQMEPLTKYDDNSGLCYDKATKIIYMYSTDGLDSSKNNLVSYSPYYVMDSDNNPVIGVYNGDN